MSRPLARRHLAGPALDVAPSLLGCRLVSELGGPRVVVRLTEVEAYHGGEDPASHAFRGRTARNAVMFGPAGHVYVYFTYGLHWCANVVCGSPGTASAVLLRAGEVIEGETTARERRPAARAARDLARGPARLATALGIDRTAAGLDLCDAGSPLRLLPRAHGPAGSIVTGPRVGVSAAAARPWRFWLGGEPSVSTYRPGKRVVAVRQD